MTYFKRILLITQSLFLFSFFSFSQTTQEGWVKTADTNEPVPYAIIKIQNSKVAFSCNESGYFKNKFTSFPVTLQISSVGYATSTIEVQETDTLINIFLQPVSLNLNEVNVYASRSNLQASSLTTLKSIESYNLAGTTKDIFRSVQMLPGVSSNNAMNARYNVRGGTYDENLILINGIEVAEPYHIKVFPFASIGIFNIDLVQRIDFSAGGFSAEYGDALSSVMSVDYRKANNDSITGRVSLGMIDLGIVSEIPMGKKASLLFGARRSYLDPVVKMIDSKDKVSVRYYDIQTKFDYEINSRHKLSAFAIYSQDADKIGPQMHDTKNYWNDYINQQMVDVSRSERNNFLLDSKYNDLLLALSSRHILSGKFILNSEISFYHERENSPQYSRDTVTFAYSSPLLFNRAFSQNDDIKDYDITNYEYKLSGKIMFNQNNNTKTGIYIRHADFDYKRTISSSTDLYNNTDHYPDTVSTIYVPANVEQNNYEVFKAHALKFGGYVTHVWDATSKLTFNLGARFDYFELNKRLDISPRTNISYLINPDLKLTAAWGIFYKTPLMKQLKYNFATSENTKSQKTTQYMVGIERKQNEITLKIEGYYKKYNDLIPVLRTSTGELIYDVKDNSTEGYATGIDFEFVVTKKKFDFWFNYSLGDSKERLKGTTNYYSRYTDQRHTVSSLLSLKLRNRIEFDIKATYGSGYAYQENFWDATAKQWVLGNEIKTAYLPYYFSLDLRFKKDFKVFSRPLQFYVDVVNILNRKNCIGHRYETNDNKPDEEDMKFLGIIPTLGLIFDF